MTIQPHCDGLPFVAFIDAMVPHNVKHILPFAQPMQPPLLTHYSLIISITGGARSFALSEDMAAAIRKGLLRAAENTSAWIVTGGTNSGVMKLVGEIMSDQYTSSYRAPLIGVGGSWVYCCVDGV